MAVYGYVKLKKGGRENIYPQEFKAFDIPEENLFLDEEENGSHVFEGMVRTMAAGDILIIKDLGCLGESWEEIVPRWRKITVDCNAAVRIIDMDIPQPVEWGRVEAGLALKLMEFALFLERNTEKARREKRLAAARAVRSRQGNKSKHFPPGFDDLYRKWRAGEIQTEEVMRACQMKRTSFYKHLKEYEILLGRNAAQK